MDLKKYLFGLQRPAREGFASRVGASIGHLQNVAYGHKPCAAELAIAIDRESKGAVRFETLRPDVDISHLRGSAQ